MRHERDSASQEDPETTSPLEEGGEPEVDTGEPPQSQPQSEGPDFREKYLRELAEKENVRKRLLREQQEMIRLAGEKSAIELLLPIDQLEQALALAQSMSPEIRNWATGFEMICGQFRDWLAGQGIRPFRSEGEMFTPQLHEAVERIIDNERPAGLILREFTKGYQGRTRVLRPARVAVCAHETPVADVQGESSAPESENKIHTSTPTDHSIPGATNAKKEK